MSIVRSILGYIGDLSTMFCMQNIEPEDKTDGIKQV